MSKRRLRRDKPSYWGVDAGAPSPTIRETARKGSTILSSTTWRTRRGWSLLGYAVRRGSKGMLVPKMPTSAANLHIKNVRVYSDQEAYRPEYPLLPDRQKFRPFEEFAFTTRVYYTGDFLGGTRRPRRGRPRIHAKGTMDEYKFTYQPGMNSGDWAAVAPRRTVIYPAQGLLSYVVEKDCPDCGGVIQKRKRVPKELNELKCLECDKGFEAKRSDAKYCSQACQKKAVRRVRDKCD